MSQINIQRHRELEAKGLLYINQHAELPLLIHNYTPRVQYERLWMPETLMSRGLITDLQGRIIARPFGKFFNLDEHLAHYGPMPNETFDVFEKMDGSLGILYFVEGKPHIATRGSFSSEQALRANQILQDKYAHVKFDSAQTYLLEIIYPENRIVVNYGDQEDLILLGAITTASGREVSLEQLQIGMPLVKRYDGVKDLDTLRKIQADNREGFVIRFHSGLRVKLKFDEYVRLHKVISGISARVIWENLKEGKDIDVQLEDVPDEFYQWVKEVQNGLKMQFAAIEEEAKAVYREFPSRKEAAVYFLGTGVNSKVLFCMLDNKPYDKVIWQMLRPEHKRPFG